MGEFQRICLLVIVSVIIIILIYYFPVQVLALLGILCVAKLLRHDKHGGYEPDNYLDVTNLSRLVQAVYQGHYNNQMIVGIQRENIVKNIECPELYRGADAKKLLRHYDIERDLKTGCFSFRDNKKFYDFIKNSRGLITDTYVNAIAPETGEKFVVFLIRYFHDIIDAYTKIYNANSSAVIRPMDIIVLYKGGNMINYYIRRFMERVQPKVRLPQHDDHMKILETTKKRGDWDFNVYFSDTVQSLPDFLKVKNDILELLVFALSEIRVEVNDKLRLDYHDLAKQVQKKYFEEPAAKDFLIRAFPNGELYDVAIPQWRINSENITRDPISLNKQSFILLPRRRTKVKDYIEFDNFLNLQNQNAAKSDIFVSVTTDITLQYRLKVKFTLARLKVNNVLRIKDNDQIEEYGIPAELVDLAFSDENSEFYMAFHQAMHNKPVYELVNWYGQRIPIPSIYYLYNDLKIIMTDLSYYIWDDRKYQKRLLRLVFLAGICDMLENDPQFMEKLQNLLKLYKDNLFI